MRTTPSVSKLHMARSRASAMIGAGAIALVALPAGVANASSAPPLVPICTAGYSYYNITKAATDQHKLGPLLEDYNGGSTTIDEDFTATVSGTLSVTVTGTAGWSASIIVADVKADLSLSVQASVTGTIGTIGKIETPAHYYALGQFGIWYYVTSGDYGYVNGNCSISNVKAIDANVPHSAGFNMWTSKTG